MIAITIQLPYSAAIRAGVKQVENRGKAIHRRHIGSPVAIHAAAAWSKAGGTDPHILNWWWGPGCHEIGPGSFTNLFRKVVAVATIAGSHEADGQCCQPWGSPTYGDKGKPAWHIELADIVALDEPVGPVRGSLAVPWTLPADVAGKIWAQVGAAL